MLGLEAGDLRDGAAWVDTGSEQLIVPLASPEAVARCAPDARLLGVHGANSFREGLVYAWAWASDEEDEVRARFFFLKHGSLVEDPGTGSACANLGGWFVSRGEAPPRPVNVLQGERTGRPCRLGLHVDTDAGILVTGRVVAMGNGEIVLGASSPTR